MFAVLQALVRPEDTGHPGFFDSIISSRGSTPCHARSKIIVSGNGEATGNIAGGEQEYRVIKNILEQAKTLQSDLSVENESGTIFDMKKRNYVE